MKKEKNVEHNLRPFKTSRINFGKFIDDIFKALKIQNQK